MSTNNDLKLLDAMTLSKFAAKIGVRRLKMSAKQQKILCFCLSGQNPLFLVKLHLVQLGIVTSQGQQFLVVAHFYDLPLV